MSNEEKRRRLNYRLCRKKRITFQIVLIIILSFISLFSAVTFYKKDKASYINYKETSNVDYKVYLKENDTFEEEYLGKGQAYIASLIDHITADFSYELNMEAKDVIYEYSYRIDATIEILDKDLNEPLYHPTIKLVDEKKFTQNSGNKLKINEVVDLDYVEFNNKAQSIIEIYHLTNTVSTLKVSTHISVIGVCDEFENDSKNDCSISLNIPLTRQTISVSMSSSIAASGNKIPACNVDDTAKALFLKTAIVTGGFDLIAIIILVIYTLVTRNTDINYDRKVKRILSQYKSFIQVLKNEFVMDGYQILNLSTIRELLEIRDTLQKPILMKENSDRTASKFFIPTNENIVYVYEIRVEDYDDIYNEEVVETEEKVSYVEKKITKKPTKIRIRQEIIINDKNKLEKPTEETKEEKEEPKIVYGTRHNYSFEAKMALSDFQIRHHHKEILDFAHSYGLKVSRSWKQERIYLGKKTFALLSFKGKKLCVALALEPKEYENSKYKFVDMTNVKRYQSTPFMFKITSERKVKHSLELLKVVLEKEGIENQNLQIVNKKISSKHKKALIEKGLIKVIESEKQRV